MKILVTGTAGFIGSTLTLCLLERRNAEWNACAILAQVLAWHPGDFITIVNNSPERAIAHATRGHS
jgi:nucleoside-diphosphate-sugar epimerase